MNQSTSVGGYLAARLAQAGLRDFFSVPGDFNLVLLDEFLKQPELRMVGCCNELNAGYAADGYARSTGGLSVVVVTYMVGGLSVINAAAGAYSDDLPLLVVSGGPNTNDAPENHLLHHTIGERDIYQAVRCFEPVVAATFVIRHASDAPGMIDAAVSTCLARRKPVYLEIACNLASAKVPAPAPLTLPPAPRAPDALALEAAVCAAAERINAATKPVLVAGVKLRSQQAVRAFLKLADALGCAVAAMPDAKGLIPEDHPSFIGTYWGEVGSPNCAEIVESSDCQIFAGPMFNDYTTTGWTTLTPAAKLVHAGPDFLRMPGAEFSGIALSDFLEALAGRVTRNETSLISYRRQHEALPPPVAAAECTPLSLKELRRQFQELVSPETDIVVETGDSWFNGQKLHLPAGAGYFFQMQYGSIGWATGSTLGVSLGAAPGRRTLALIGDGSFQLTVQEVSTMIRYNADAIIFLLNNRGYTIEVEIHDGPYNNIKNWDYAGLMDIFNADEGNGLGLRATTSGELSAAIAKAISHKGTVLIECSLDRDDCSPELLQWGTRVAAANSRP
ncbi:MAG: thiamine pyrophosphate-binding protein [Terrimicrobiaceae bacterium]